MLLTTSNGTGMGHLSRQLAVALALGERASTSLVSMSAAAPVLRAAGIASEYLPDYTRGWMPRSSWPGYLAERLAATLHETGARVVVFDGVAPYPGLRLLRRWRPDVAFVWFRRGLWRPGHNRRALAAAAVFDLVLEPGDLAAPADSGATRGLAAVRLAPVALTESVPALPREAAVERLGLDPSKQTLLVTLGLGSLEAQRPSLGSAAVRRALRDPGWQVALTRAPAPGSATFDSLTSGSDPALAHRVVDLHGVHPLVAYVSAFDAAVSAAGYNAVHELLPSGVPTVLVPFLSTTDDQTARARYCAGRGWALVAHDDTEVETAVGRLLDRDERLRLRRAGGSIATGGGGAAQAADAILQLAGPEGFTGHASGLRERVAAARVDLVRRLGPEASDSIRWLLRRPRYVGTRRPLRLRLRDDRDGSAVPAPGELLVTERLDAALLAGGDPVEVLLAGASGGYRDARIAVARRYYHLNG